MKHLNNNNKSVTYTADDLLKAVQSYVLHRTLNDYGMADIWEQRMLTIFRSLYEENK